MRTNIKDRQYFAAYIERETQRIEKLLDWIEIGKVKEDRIPSTRGEIFRASLQLIIARYSAGQSVDSLGADFKQTINRMAEVWQDLPKGANGKINLENYILALWMVSLGILLEIEEADFERIAAILEESKVEDYLLDFLIPSRIKEHRIADTLLHEKPYQSLIEAIKTENKDEAVEKLKVFLDKQWYRAMSPTYWFENHKSKHDTFFGYWSFESAAAAKIAGLDDESLKQQSYYPYDAAHWQ